VAGPTQVSARLAARPTVGEASIALRLRTLTAEIPARIRRAGARGPQPERAEESAGQGGPEQPERMAARNGLLGQRFGQIINVMGHVSLPTWYETTSCSASPFRPGELAGSSKFRLHYPGG